jgi:hypothetical protein
LFVFACAVGVVFCGRPASAESLTSDALQIELNEMAKQIKAVVSKKGGGAVAIGGFTAATSIRGNNGPEIQLKLSEALQALELVVKTDDYRFEIVGNYQPFEDPSTKLQGVKVVGRVVDAADGGTLAEFPRFVFGEEAVPRLLGLSVQTPANADPKLRSDKFKDALKNPEIKLTGATIRNPDSPYALAVLVKEGDKYVPRAATEETGGRPFVPIKKSEVYGLRLINDSDAEAAVALTIDGIEDGRFSQEEPRLRFWIVGPKSHVDVFGWHITREKSIEFKVTDFPDTAAAKVKLKPSEQIGMITAAFSAAWQSDDDKPADEASGRGTGFGAEIKFKTQAVKRFIGHTRDTITVRYERAMDK